MHKSQALATASGVDPQWIRTKLSVAEPRTVHSQVIHHREVPKPIGQEAVAAVICYRFALRYTRIFPETFDQIDIGDVLTDNPKTKNVTTRYRVGVGVDGGKWETLFYSFTQSNAAQI